MKVYRYYISDCSKSADLGLFVLHLVRSFVKILILVLCCFTFSNLILSSIIITLMGKNALVVFPFRAVESLLVLYFPDVFIYYARLEKLTLYRHPRAIQLVKSVWVYCFRKTFNTHLVSTNNIFIYKTRLQMSFRKSEKLCHFGAKAVHRFCKSLFRFALKYFPWPYSRKLAIFYNSTFTGECTLSRLQEVYLKSLSRILTNIK